MVLGLLNYLIPTRVKVMEAWAGYIGLQKAHSRNSLLALISLMSHLVNSFIKALAAPRAGRDCIGVREPALPHKSSGGGPVADGDAGMLPPLHDAFVPGPLLGKALDALALAQLLALLHAAGGVCGGPGRLPAPQRGLARGVLRAVHALCGGGTVPPARRLSDHVCVLLREGARAAAPVRGRKARALAAPVQPIRKQGAEAAGRGRLRLRGGAAAVGASGQGMEEGGALLFDVVDGAAHCKG